MIEKDIRNNIIDKYKAKEEKILVGRLIDDVNKFDSKNHIVHTKFLNIHEKNIALSVLNKLNIRYKIFDIIKDIERTVIFLIPEYLRDIEVFSDYIVCIRIVPSVKNKLKHKDYMGAIYSLGITDKMIGDIFVIEDVAYVFVFRDNLKFIQENLAYVSSVKVTINTVELDSEIINKIRVSFKDMNIRVNSLRIDVILSEVYNLSRKETKRKIDEGDLVVNSNQMYYVAYDAKENDIVSFRKCGKFRIGKIIANTKNNKIILEIKIYN